MIHAQIVIHCTSPRCTTFNCFILTLLVLHFSRQSSLSTFQALLFAHPLAFTFPLSTVSLFAHIYTYRERPLSFDLSSLSFFHDFELGLLTITNILTI
ncbi:hypothetical protein BGZ63DRAFT_7404 [Mariannaea sp. PMI_226]|nr:hypothetical protein BGZ63DRAFT_7404 [Mariannaea sp. PMI_226]